MRYNFILFCLFVLFGCSIQKGTNTTVSLKFCKDGFTQEPVMYYYPNCNEKLEESSFALTKNKEIEAVFNYGFKDSVALFINGEKVFYEYLQTDINSSSTLKGYRVKTEDKVISIILTIPSKRIYAEVFATKNYKYLFINRVDCESEDDCTWIINFKNNSPTI